MKTGCQRKNDQIKRGADKHFRLLKHAQKNYGMLATGNNDLVGEIAGFLSGVPGSGARQTAVPLRKTGSHG